MNPTTLASVMGFTGAPRVTSRIVLRTIPVSRATSRIPISTIRFLVSLSATAFPSLDSEDAIHNKARSLSLKLVPRDNKLAGRILASAAGPGELATLPYVVSLSRSK